MLEKFTTKEYLSGEKLVGDDFSNAEIYQWYKEEEEAYSDLVMTEQKGDYLYENINNFYGLKSILSQLTKKMDNVNILCFGAAYGGEVRSIMNILDRYDVEYSITVIDSSSKMLEAIQSELNVNVVKSAIDGSIDFSPNSFDLITCFGVLHHIPNVTYVLEQLIKVLKKEGLLFLREPISSMGNWQSKRVGTTPNERGISLTYLKKTLTSHGTMIVFTKYAFFSPILKVFKKLNLSIESYFVIYVDYVVSKLFFWNIRYQRDSFFKKLAPGSVFILAQKK